MRRLVPATSQDVEEISTLVNSAYRGESSRAGWTTEADYLDGQRTDPATLTDELKRNTILLLREGEDLIGCVNLEQVSARGTCYLGMLTIKPTRQADGLGRELLKGAEDFARAQGARTMILGVVQVRDTLIAWYLRRGYKPNGETKPFPYGQEQFGRPRRPDLHFVFFEKSLV